MLFFTEIRRIFCMQKGAYVTRRRVLILYGVGGLFYTEKATRFSRRMGPILHEEEYTFCTEKGAYIRRRRVHILHGEGGLF